jgi:hypothetical protein
MCGAGRAWGAFPTRWALVHRGSAASACRAYDMQPGARSDVILLVTSYLVAQRTGGKTPANTAYDCLPNSFNV